MISRDDPRLAGAAWRKSSLSDNANGCVEIAHLEDGSIALGDTKDPRDAHLFTPHEWRYFIQAVKDGEFDI